MKRNTILLALSQALVGAGMQMVPVLGPLLAIELLGSATMAGASVSIVGVSRLVVAYPIGKIMDVYGRRAGLVLGLFIGIIGALVTGFSVFLHSFPIFALGMFIFGLGSGAAQQLRLAAADMYPPSRRAEGLGYVLTGSLIGALGGTLVINLAQSLSTELGLPPLATPWLLVPAAVLPTMALIWCVRPDPKEIALHLDQYYPGYAPEPRATIAASGGGGIPDFLRDYPKLVAIVAGFSSQGAMSIVMVVTSLALAYSGHSLTAISFSASIHVIGMFAFSLPLGRLSDKISRRTVLATGAVITIVGTLLVPTSPEFWVITLGGFLVGLGWSCINIAATAVIADTTRPNERGRAIGVNDGVCAASGIILPFLAGPMADRFGLISVGVLGALVMFVTLPMAMRLRESAPGKFE